MPGAVCIIHYTMNLNTGDSLKPLAIKVCPLAASGALHLLLYLALYLVIAGKSG